MATRKVVETGRHHVEQNQIERMRARRLEGAAAVAGLFEHEPRQPQVQPQELADRELVFHDEHAARGTGH
jgi:hypothetical protein